MKKLFILPLMLALFTVCVRSVQAQDEYTRDRNNFTKIATVTQSSDVLTDYTYTIKDIKYPIWITKNGRCYVVRVSKSGNEYRQYLPENIAREICQELGVEYIEKKNYDSQH